MPNHLTLVHNPFVRKALTQARSIRRSIRCLSASSIDFETNPPILCNSFPKSGTHLLLQILTALPNKLSYGSFIASTPPISFRRRSESALRRRIRSIAPGEVVPAHLYFSPQSASALNEKHCVNFFIYRDLRDVVLSEAHYLYRMAWWHALHRSFKKAKTKHARLQLSIGGLVDRYPEYPDIRARFGFYEGWLDRTDTLGIRFEDLIGDTRESTLRRIAEFYSQRTGKHLDHDSFVENAVKQIKPNSSHTFNRGEAGRWRSEFSPELELQFNEAAGDIMSRLGY